MSRKVFSAVKMGAPDAILGLTDAFRKSSNVRKVNLGVGAYRDASGNPVVLPSVRDAISRINGDVSLNHEYAPIDGVPEFVSAAQKLMFGSCSASMNEKRTRSVQCLSGTGSLRVGAEFLMRHSGVTKSVYLSNPTWGNHAPLFRASGFNVFTYDYYNAAKKGLDFEKMCESLQSAERGAVVVLHACAHNPTGFDPSMDQWLTIRDILRQRELFPFLDCAYQGFATGDIDVDAAPVRLFDDDSRYPFAVAQSFAKNFGLYGERIGLLSFVSSDAEEAERVLSQVKIIIRSMYSNPPLFGARVVATILNNPTLFHQWKGEVKGLSKRLQDVRSELHRVLTKLSEDLADPKALQWDTILQQTGMFSYTGLTPEEVDELVHTYGIFMTRDGRISLAGLNSSNVQYVAESIHKVAAKRFQD